MNKLKEPLQIPYTDEDMENVRELAVERYREFINNRIEHLKSEPMSLCLDCNTKWTDLIKVCEKCGAKFSKEPYKSRIEYYVDYDEIDEAFEDIIKKK